MEKRKILYITWFLSTVTLCQGTGCPFEAVPGDPYKYLIKAANIKTICAPGTKFSVEACTCVSAPNDPRLKSKQETRSKFPANDAVVKQKSDSLFTSHSGAGIADRNNLFKAASVSGIGHNTFSGSLSTINNGHLTSFKFPSNKEPKIGGFVTGESFGTPKNTDSLFDFPPKNNAGDPQILLNEPVYPRSKPIHFTNTERRGNQIKHSSISIHPGIGSSRISTRAQVSGRHDNIGGSHQSSFSFTDPQPQDFFNWPLLPQRDDTLGFDLFHTPQTNHRSPFDITKQGDRIHSGVPMPPNRGRSPLDVPPPPPPKSIEHRLYIENENLSSLHMDRLKPKPVQVNKSTRKRVSQHTLDMIRAWFTGGHTPLDVHYTDKFVHGKDSRTGQTIDTRHPQKKISNTDALFNLPDSGPGPRDQFGNTDALFSVPDHGAGPRDQLGNTDALFNLPDNIAGPHGKPTITNTDDLFNVPNTASVPHDLPGNTDHLFNLPTADPGPHDIPGNTDQLFDLSSVSEVSGGSNNASPKNKVPLTQKSDIQTNNPLPPLGSHLTGLTHVSQFLDLGNGQHSDKAMLDAKPNSKVSVKNFDNSFGDSKNPKTTTSDFPSDIPSFVFDPAGESFGLNEVHTVGNANVGSKKITNKLPDLHQVKTNPGSNVAGKFNDGFLDTSILPGQIIDIGGSFNNGQAIDGAGLNKDQSSSGKIIGKEIVPPQNETGKTDVQNLHITSGIDRNLDLNGHIPDPFMNQNEFIPGETVNGQINIGSGHPLDGHLPGHVNKNEFVPVNGATVSSNNNHASQSGGPFGSFDNDEDVINLLNEVDIDTLLDAIGGIPLHEIDTQALKMFQRKVNQLINVPKQEPTIKKLINNKNLISAPVKTVDNTIQSRKTKASLTLSAQELSQLHQKLQREIDRITIQEAAEKKKAQALANLKAERKAQRQAIKQAKKELQEKRRLAKQQAKTERMVRMEKARIERKAKQERLRMERKARQQKANQERKARREQARLEKKALQEEKRKQRQEQRRLKKQIRAAAKKN